MKLATWNLELPASARHRDALLSHIDREKADVWVFTETRDGFTPGHAFFQHSSDEGRDGLDPSELRWVTIWSRYPMEPLETGDPKRTAAALLRPRTGEPFIVYGTVLPWVGSEWRGYTSSDGVAFREALAVQAADWMQLRKDYPAHELFVLGDFNQDMVSSPHHYGSRENRTALERAIADAGMVALTAGAGDPVRRLSAPCAAIDHICVRRDSSWRAEPAIRWPDAPVPEPDLSAHFGLSVSLVQT